MGAKTVGAKTMEMKVKKMINTLLGITIVTKWAEAPASFYWSGKQTADGTKMSTSGNWVATYLAPLGSTLEVKSKRGTFRLIVRDRTAKRFGHRLDIPKHTWRRITGEDYSKGIVILQWRRIK